MQSRFLRFLKIATVFVVMSLTGLTGLLLRVLSFGFLTRWNRRCFFKYQSRLLLKILGMRLDIPEPIVVPERQVLITFNHNSYLDVLMLIALGLDNTRFLLSVKTIRIFPVTISALAIGVLYIPQQFQRDRRLQFFKRTTAKMKKEDFSLAASSEGVHDHFHGIGKFNRGIYHLAIAAEVDILPLFIYVPRASNPFNHYGAFSKGVVRIEALPVIKTQLWTLNALNQHKDEVRRLYVNKFNACQGTSIT